MLRTATAGGPTGRELFDPRRVALETACLLLSSFTCGLSAVATQARNQLWTQVFLLVTGLLGLAFLLLEVQEFAGMLAAGRRAAAQRLPLVFLRAGRLPRPARHGRACCGSAR